MEQQHGLLIVDKPRGLSSARCANRLKRLGQKKIGHAGTLDPMATGVLLLLLGHATKIAGYLLAGGEKIYRGTLRLGQTTDTWDAEGRLVAQAPWRDVPEEAVEAIVRGWIGESEQVVPPYSAAKHEGQPLYRLSRAGKDTPVKTKRIVVSRAEILEMELPDVSFRVTCGSGTYIRSLAHSLGTRLGCGAVLTALTREYSHPFGLDKATPLEALLEEPDLLTRQLLPVTAALDWPIVRLSEEEAERVRHGAAIGRRPAEGALARTVLTETTSAREQDPEERAILLAPDGTPLALARAGSSERGPVWILLRGL